MRNQAVYDSCQERITKNIDLKCKCCTGSGLWCCGCPNVMPVGLFQSLQIVSRMFHLPAPLEPCSGSLSVTSFSALGSVTIHVFLTFTVTGMLKTSSCPNTQEFARHQYKSAINKGIQASFLKTLILFKNPSQGIAFSSPSSFSIVSKGHLGTAH